VPAGRTGEGRQVVEKYGGKTVEKVYGESRIEPFETLAHNEKAKLYFDSEEWVSNSNINDYQNLIQFIDNTLLIVDIQIKRNSDILDNSNDAYKQLQLLNMSNNDLIEIKIYLLSKFDFSLEHLKDKLIFMKSEAKEYLDTIDDSLSIWTDENLSHKKINFNFTAKNENKNTPICLPKNNPHIIPKGTGFIKLLIDKLFNETPAFAKANKGIIPNAT
jgi:hypothetical protein